MNKSLYYNTSQNSPRRLSQKRLKLKLSKSKLNPLSLNKNLNLSIVKRPRNRDSHNTSLSNVNSTNILNLFTASFESNKSSQSNQSYKSILSKKEDIEGNSIALLKNIQIKDSSVNDSFQYQGGDQSSNTVSFKKLHADDMNESKKNKIWINISTIYNKGDSSSKHLKKPNPVKTKEESRNEMKRCNNNEISMSTASDNGYGGDGSEVMRLKKKITDLLEVNAMLVNSRQELEKENHASNKTIRQLKKYITENKIEDIKALQRKVKDSNEEIKKCNEVIRKMQEDNCELRATQSNYPTNSSNSQIKTTKTVIENNAVNTLQTTQERNTFSSFLNLNKKPMSNCEVMPPLLKKGLELRSKPILNIPKLHYKRKQQKISASNHQSYDLDVTDI